MACIEPYSSISWKRCRSKAGCEAWGRVIWMRCPKVCKPCCSQKTARIQSNLMETKQFQSLTRNTSAHLYITDTMLVRTKYGFCLKNGNKKGLLGILCMTNLDEICCISIVVNSACIEPSPGSFPSEPRNQGKRGNGRRSISRWCRKCHCENSDIALYCQNLRY